MLATAYCSVCFPVSNWCPCMGLLQCHFSVCWEQSHLTTHGLLIVTMMLCKLDVIGSTRFTVTSAHTQTVARQLASSALQEADTSSVLNRRRGCHLCKVFELRAITTQMKVNCLFGSGGLVSCSMIAHH